MSDLAESGHSFRSVGTTENRQEWSWSFQAHAHSNRQVSLAIGRGTAQGFLDTRHHRHSETVERPPAPRNATGETWGFLDQRQVRVP